MAKDLKSEISFLPQGDFTQKDIIQNGVFSGKQLPTSQSIFKSNEKQKVFLELWNETEKPINVFIRVGDKIYQNGLIGVCDEQVYAHTFHQIEIQSGDEIFASASSANAVSYNIIL